MAEQTEIVTGDEVAILATVLTDDVAVDLSGQTVRAAIVSSDHLTLMAGPVTQDEAAISADWTNGIVVIEFSAAVTDALKAYLPTYKGRMMALVELEANPGSMRQTWFGSVAIVRGQID